MSAPYTYDVFLSYCHRDARRVRTIALYLKNAGLNVWFDQWTVPHGGDIYLSVEQGLETARTLLLFLSPAALDSELTTLERSTALFRDPGNAQRSLIPVLLTDCILPDTLRRFRHVDLRKTSTRALAELLDACRPPGHGVSPTSLERDALALLHLLPGSSVTHAVDIAGTQIATLCTLTNTFMPPFRMAVHCIDATKPVTHDQVASLLLKGIRLLDDNVVDQCLLVTRHGLSPDAVAAFDGKRLRHLTFVELADKVFDPQPLLDNMIRHFSVDSLKEFYVHPRISGPTLEFAGRHYDLLYNDFIDFAIETGCNSLPSVRLALHRVGDTTLQALVSTYDDARFERALRERISPPKVDAEDFVGEWARRDDVPHGLAILGSYGTGKSSLARRLAYKFADNYRMGHGSRIPLLLELKDFTAHQDVKGLITHELVNRHRVANGSFEMFQSLNEAGRLILLLDGFDEMKEGMTLDALVYNFYQLGTLLRGRAKVMLFGRPTIFESQSEQTRILTGNLTTTGPRQAKYVQASINPFTIDETCAFMLGYSKVRAPEHLGRISKFVAELRDEVRRNEELHSLVSRPVHLPMLVAVLPRLKLREIGRASCRERV